MAEVKVDEERVRRYRDTVRWTRAKSYEGKAPHEYTVRKWHPELDDEFCWIVQHIRDVGTPQKFGGRKYIYLYLDGYRYWTMGCPMKITIILNRCPADQQHDYIKPKSEVEATVDQIVALANS